MQGSRSIRSPDLHERQIYDRQVGDATRVRLEVFLNRGAEEKSNKSDERGEKKVTSDSEDEGADKREENVKA